MYVAGLSKFAEKSDLEKVFKTVSLEPDFSVSFMVVLLMCLVTRGLWMVQYGPIKEIRMTVDEQGRSKGFAFVEFEQEASLFLTRR